MIAAEDGLRLHVRDFTPRHLPGSPPALPVLCLPGLTRTAADFEVLATALNGDATRSRRVLAMDSRGRGLSDRDPDPAHYTVPVEARDVLTAMDILGVHRAIVVGSSRGGLVALTLAAMRPAFLAGVVFNDIGPAIEMSGLLRIAGYAGKPGRPRDFDDGAQMLQHLFGAQFPRLGAGGWLAWARRAWEERNGNLVPTYDPAVAVSLAELDPARPVPALWELFDRLPAVPLLVVRGENSDILSCETVAHMRARRPGMASATVAGEGHTPLLADASTIALLRDFALRCEA